METLSESEIDPSVAPDEKSPKEILSTLKMFCFDHFVAWLFLLDMVFDGLATAKFHNICYQRDICQYWWLSLLFMVLPTLIFICAILLIAIKQTKRIDHLVNYAILACFYPIIASLGIIITIINTFCGRKGTNQGQSLIMLPEFLFEAIPQAILTYYYFYNNGWPPETGEWILLISFLTSVLTIFIGVISSCNTLVYLTENLPNTYNAAKGRHANPVGTIIIDLLTLRLENPEELSSVY